MRVSLKHSFSNRRKDGKNKNDRFSTLHDTLWRKCPRIAERKLELALEKLSGFLNLGHISVGEFIERGTLRELSIQHILMQDAIHLKEPFQFQKCALKVYLPALFVPCSPFLSRFSDFGCLD